MGLREAIEDVATHAIGRTHRADEEVGKSGGPAGNARLTAWTGLILLVLFVAELVTLLDVRSWISWHVALGVLLIPPSLLKTASTGWRIVRYYAGNQPYRNAGPPPMLLRLLGPLVVVSTLGVLGSGLAIVLIAPATARGAFLSLGAFGLRPLMIHKGFFVVWAVVTGLHTLARIVPALALTVLRPHPVIMRGIRSRAVAIGTTVIVAVAAAIIALPLANPWRHEPRLGRGDLHHHSGNR